MRKVLLMALLSTATATYAIVPVDKLASAPDGISGNIGIAIEGEEGNRKEQEYNLNGIFRYGWGGNNSLMWISDYDYTKTDGVTNEEDFSTHLRFIRNDYFSQGIDAEAFMQYEYDDFADLSSRRLAGGGVRWRYETSETESTFRIRLGAGAFYETEKSKRTTVNDNTVRANFYGTFRYTVSDNRAFDFYGSAYLQPSISALNDMRVLVVSGIEFPITSALSLSIEAEADHDSDPFEGVKKTNLEYGVKLSYSF